MLLKQANPIVMMISDAEDLSVLLTQPPTLHSREPSWHHWRSHQGQHMKCQQKLHQQQKYQNITIPWIWLCTIIYVESWKKVSTYSNRAIRPNCLLFSPCSPGPVHALLRSLQQSESSSKLTIFFTPKLDHNIFHWLGFTLQLGSGPGENEQNNIIGSHPDDTLHLGAGDSGAQLCGVWLLHVQSILLGSLSRCNLCP